MTETKAIPTVQSQAIGLLHDIAVMYDALMGFKKPLTLEQAVALIEKYGYDNTVIYVTKLANRNEAAKKYASVYLTLDNWLREDLASGKIRKGVSYCPVPPNDINGCVFLKQFPVGSTIVSHSGNRFIVNDKIISSIDGTGSAMLISSIKRQHPNGIFPFSIFKQN